MCQKMSNVKKSKTLTMDEFHKKINLTQWGSHTMRSILRWNMNIIKNVQKHILWTFWRHHMWYQNWPRFSNSTSLFTVPYPLLTKMFKIQLVVKLHLPMTNIFKVQFVAKLHSVIKLHPTDNKKNCLLCSIPTPDQSIQSPLHCKVPNPLKQNIESPLHNKVQYPPMTKMFQVQLVIKLHPPMTKIFKVLLVAKLCQL